MIFIACDPGVSGAIAVLYENGDSAVFDIPTFKTHRGKTDYKVDEMASILRPFSGKDVVFFIEDVHAMIGNGNVSSFNFGRGKGLWEGIAHAFSFDVRKASPQTWKKHYPILKADKVEIKDSNGKTPKEKKEMASALAKEKRLVKAAAKAKARELAAAKFPEHADVLKTVNSDGRAEALLMAVYIKEQSCTNKEM